MNKILEEYYKKNNRRKPETYIEDIEAISHLDWLKARQSGIGGSDAGAIYLGKGKFKTAFEVSLNKTASIEKDDDNSPEDEFRFGYGHCIEEVLLKWYEQTTGTKVFVDRGMYRNPEAPFMLADCDGFAELNDGTVIGLECKSTSPYNKPLWQSGIFGENGNVGVDDYLFQVMHYMSVLDLDRFDIIVDFKQGLASDICVVTVKRDELLINSLISKERYFWENINSIEFELPESCSKETSKRIVEALSKKNVEFENLESSCEEIYELLDKKKTLNDKIKAIDEQINASKIGILTTMQDKEKLTIGDYLISNHRVVSVRFDTKELKKMPELDQYKKESASYRFDVKKIKGE